MEQINITKPEIRFWMAIITVIVSFTVAFVSLSKDIEAITERERGNKEIFEDICITVEETHDTVLRMEEKQNQILERLNKLER